MDKGSDKHDISHGEEDESIQKEARRRFEYLLHHSEGSTASRPCRLSRFRNPLVDVLIVGRQLSTLYEEGRLTGCSSLLVGLIRNFRSPAAYVVRDAEALAFNICSHSPLPHGAFRHYSET